MTVSARVGDQARTCLTGTEDAERADRRIEAVGSLDELVAILGVAKTEMADEDLYNRLEDIQTDLYLLLATAASSQTSDTGIQDEAIDLLDYLVETYRPGLPSSPNLALPGGSRASATLDHARTVCRRAERQVLRLTRCAPVPGAVPNYLNRLSELLSVFARVVDHRSRSVRKMATRRPADRSHIQAAY